jgi:hypothetical protein
VVSDHCSQSRADCGRLGSSRGTEFGEDARDIADEAPAALDREQDEVAVMREPDSLGVRRMLADRLID